jgi:hypothetical protein
MLVSIGRRACERGGELAIDYCVSPQRTPRTQRKDSVILKYFKKEKDNLTQRHRDRRGLMFKLLEDRICRLVKQLGE